ncbi:MAG: FAD-binding oxidoreductase [Gloeobacteraceae cyanobacterium ES-bin-144]|nr:FAD-binding oxidoreductase [Verrucomicrobiales bacterium]
MNTDAKPWLIVGQGLAGTCLAWELWKRGAEFSLVDGEIGGSSRMAAGLINPVTGKNFEPSVRIGEFLPQAMEFYADVEKRISLTFWYSLPVLRLAGSEAEWRKMELKSSQPEVSRWIANNCAPVIEDGWLGGYELTGGGRLDTLTFLDASREFFRSIGLYQKLEIAGDDASSNRIWCDGSTGLLTGKYGPHRCAKGEILTIRAEDWDASRIRIGGGGWLVPLGNGLFKAGSTYEWNDLDRLPTEAGRVRVEEIVRKLGGGDFQVIDHQAGVRPILRRSEPLIGPIGGGDWMFNGLGSKGTLYAPGIAQRLAAWLVDGVEPDAELDFRNFRETRNDE